MFNNQIIAGSSGQGGSSFYDYSIDYSLKLVDISGSYLYQTENFATDNTWTFSCWIKRNLLGDGSSDQDILHVNNNDPWEAFRWVGSDDSLSFSSFGRGGTTYVVNIYTYAFFRDPSAWYHVVFAYDAGNSTAADRQRIYVNGERMSVQGGRYGSGSGSSNTSTTSNSVLGGGYAISIGSRDGNDPDADFQIAEVHFLDGYALTPTSFGETSNGVWVPKQYTGSYGTGGSYLNFADSSDLGKDVSGQGNHWTSGSSISAHDQMLDSPTNSFCTLNPLTAGTYPVLTEGSLSIATAYSADLCGVTSTWYPTTGKWYWEIHAEGSTLTYPYFGITDQRYTMTSATQGSYYSIAWNRTGASVSLSGYMGTITKENATSWTNNDIIMFALDVDNRKLWIGKNGTWNDSGDPAAGTGENASWTVDTGVSPSWMGYQSQGVGSVFNFGQDGTFNGNQTAQGNADGNGVGNFYYSPPSGFLAMATSNIDDGNIGPNSTTTTEENFNTMLYAGNSSTNAITGVGFQPDFVWTKQRDSTNSHALSDSVRGQWKALASNLTDGEYTYTNNGLQSFDSDGYTLVGANGWYNTSGRNYVSWNWKAGGTAVSNSDGSLTCNVSANTDAGFSIVTWTANSDNGTLGHGLNSAPELIIAKPLGSGTNWYVMHTTALNANQVLNLDGTTSAFNPGVNHFNDTFPTDTVFSYGGYLGDDLSNDDKVAYCFHSVEGFSKVGKYYGNANANGPFVFTGFRPAFVLLKVSSASNNWFIYDNEREGYNPDNDTLSPNITAIEDTSYKLDLLSNGFKIRGSQNAHNQSGQTFIYLAFAEDPFKYANAR